MMDTGAVYAVSVLPPDPSTQRDSPTALQKQLQDFLMEFRIGGEFIYRYVRLYRIS